MAGMLDDVLPKENVRIPPNCTQCSGAVHNFGGILRCGTCGMPAAKMPPARPTTEEKSQPIPVAKSSAGLEPEPVKTVAKEDKAALPQKRK